MTNSTAILLLISGLLVRCQEPAETLKTQKGAEADGYFIAASDGQRTSHMTLRLLATGFGQAEIAAMLAYDVESYVVKYFTEYKGKRVEASGVVMIPVQMDAEASIVSVQHGTLFNKDEAPSLRGGLQGVEFFASAGYISILPDFLGYGTSDEVFHPYYDRQHAASTVIDFIRATREFLKQKEIRFNEKLFLAGYSEGGYVSLAAAKEIELNPEYGLSVTAVAAGAGGYDLDEMLRGITTKNYYSYPSYLAFVLMSYNQTNDWNRPLTDFFRPAYADALNKYMNGDNSGSFINSKLTTNVPGLFNPAFYSALHEPGGETTLKKALNDNSVSGWKTDTPIRLYHGTDDQIIPYANSEVTLKSFESVGSKNVSLTSLQGKGHSNGLEAMLRDFIPWFLTR